MTGQITGMRGVRAGTNTLYRYSPVTIGLRRGSPPLRNATPTPTIECQDIGEWACTCIGRRRDHLWQEYNQNYGRFLCPIWRSDTHLLRPDFFRRYCRYLLTLTITRHRHVNGMNCSYGASKLTIICSF